MKNISVALFLSGACLLFACQETANQEDGGTNSVSQDSVTTGLEGTRDQSGTIGGTEVKVDTSAGQGEEKSGDSTKASNRSGKRNDSTPR